MLKNKAWQKTYSHPSTSLAPLHKPDVCVTFLFSVWVLSWTACGLSASTAVLTRAAGWSPRTQLWAEACG